MIIEALHLENYCQHACRTLAFSPGLNLLVGPNGSGKSNILRALQFALTGDAGGDRNKLDDIYQGMQEGEQSFVLAELSHAGTDISIRRSLKPNSNEMVIGGQTWRTATEINKELWARLGTTKKQIVDYIFVGQRKVDEMFDQKPAERASSLAALFGLSHADAVWKQLGDFTNSIEVPTTLLNEDELRRRDDELAGTIEQLHAQLVQLQVPADPVRYREIRQQTIDGYNTWVRVRDTAAASDGALPGIRQKLVLVREALTGMEKDLTLLREATAIAAPEVAKARKALQQWATYHASQKAREQADECARAFAAKPVAIRAVKPDLPNLSEDELSRWSSLEGQIATYRAAIAELRSKRGTCPTCGQTLTDAAARQQQLVLLEAQLERLQVEATPLFERKLLWKEYDATLARWDAWEAEYKRVRAAQNALKAMAAPAESEEELLEIIAEQEDYLGAISSLQEQRSEKTNELAKLEGEYLQLKKQARAAVEAMATTPQYQAAAADAARADLRNLEDLLANNQALTIQLERARAEREHVAQQLREYQQITERTARTRDTIQHLNQVRQIFHRDEAPRMVSYTYIEQLLAEINSTLELFNAPYRVTMDENLGFIANFTDGIRVQPDRRLSVGERIVLAMAFRIVINSTFAGQVGMLVLDEPTAGLDEQNLGCLPEALARLRELSEERGLQVFFVTHESQLTTVFDNIIELPAATL
jgi:chromosome segregation protein